MGVVRDVHSGEQVRLHVNVVCGSVGRKVEELRCPAVMMVISQEGGAVFSHRAERRRPGRVVMTHGCRRLVCCSSGRRLSVDLFVCAAALYTGLIDA